MTGVDAPDRIGGLSADAVRQHRVMFQGSLIVSVLALSLSLSVALRAVDREQRELARAVAETHVAETVALRSWVSGQGGLYVPESADLPPNPHLPPEDRTRVTTEGVRLTLLNPAYLTRVLAEATEASAGTRIRLTSASPVSPQNTPDPWEVEALGDLRSGVDGVYAVVQDGERETFRYLAPLAAEPSCLASCHADTEVSAGGVLGAISVGVDFAPFRGAIARQRRLVFGGHAGLVLVALAVLTFLSEALRRSLVRLARAGERIGDLERLLPICATCKRVRIDDEVPAGGRRRVGPDRGLRALEPGRRELQPRRLPPLRLQAGRGDRVLTRGRC